MRHCRALAIVIAAVLIAAAAVRVTWQWLGEERRLGAVVARLLAHRTGLPITIGAAHAVGGHLTLQDLRLEAAPFRIRVSRLDLTGGLVSLLASADSSIDIVATSAAVTIAEGGPVPSVDEVRAQLLSLLDRPGTMRLTMLDGALQSAGRTFVFDLTGDKRPDGLDLSLSVGPAAERRALTVSAHATVGRAGAVQLAVELASEPRRLERLWPATLPPPATLASRADVILVKGGDAHASGRVTLGPSAVAAVVDGTARYDARSGALTATRYVLTRADGVRLEGDGALTPGPGGRHIVARAAGTVDGARVDGRVRYDVSTGAFAGDASVRGGSVRSLWKRLGLPAAPPEYASVATVQARVSGVDRTVGLTMDVDAVVGGLRLARWPGLPVDVTLKAAVHAASAADGLALDSITRATMYVTRAGTPLAVITAGSRGGTLWPLSVEARVADAGQLAPWLPLESALAGRARLTGELRPDAFAGDLVADLASATLMLGAPVTLTHVRAAVPVRWQGPATGTAGSIQVARATGHGFVAREISSPATFTDGRLVLSDVRYVHYGGRGAGTLEASMHAPLRFAARLAGDSVELADVVREAGVTIARATGRVDYVISVQHTAAHGLFLAGRVDGEAGGGEIGIDGIERLLVSSGVDADGLLRRTLESLRVFRYDALAVDVRLTGATGHVDVALEGRKRFGIFPGRVDAITLHHVPLAVLARTFGKGPSP